MFVDGAIRSEVNKILSPLPPPSEVGGLFLIDPAFEGLFSMRKTSESQDKITSWQDLWNKKILPFYQGKWLTSVIGFNRISLMLGLMSPVEDEKLIQVLDKDSITRKV